MVIGLVPDVSRAETLLNNLDEAGFSMSDVSVITRDPGMSSAIAKNGGPFRSTTVDRLAAKLQQHGLSKLDAQAYADAVRQGSAFIAIAAPRESQEAAVEMLNDYTPQRVKVIPSTE